MKPRAITYSDGKTGVIRWRKKPMAYGREVDGHSIVAERKLVCRANTTHARQAGILLHEIIHHALSPLVLDKPLREADIEEVMVNTVATNMAEMWKRNPSLFTWIHLGLTAEEDK